MTGRNELRVSRLVVASLRTFDGRKQTEFSKACGMTQPALSDYEQGKRQPPDDVLRRMARAAGVLWPAVVHLRRVFSALLAASARVSAELGDETVLLDAIIEEILPVVVPYLIEEWAAEPRGRTAAAERRLADEIVTSLGQLPAPRRRRLLELTRDASRSWAVAERLCEESARRAAHDEVEALDLAALALYVAERVPGTESWQAVVLAFCWAFLANARRVANDLDGAEEGFSRSLQLWAAGSEADRHRLAGWRLLDLEASLRRDQQRFPEALDLLDRARKIVAPNDPATGHILLNIEHVYERMGDFPAALAILDEAAPRIAASGDPRQAFLVRHKTVNNLCHLERFAEADNLLPQVRDLAARQGNGLDSLRVLWLEARVDTGRDRRDEAVRKLEEVQREFTARQLPYDAALACLDLAVLWLEAGRTAEVRELAVGMAWIFEAQKIRREALAALRLFTEAARREAATVELARRVIAELKREGLASSLAGPKPRVRPA
jgi:transcriptional regulator with XRE-family HTH domain